MQPIDRLRVIISIAERQGAGGARRFGDAIPPLGPRALLGEAWCSNATCHGHLRRNVARDLLCDPQTGGRWRSCRKKMRSVTAADQLKAIGDCAARYAVEIR